MTLAGAESVLRTPMRGPGFNDVGEGYQAGASALGVLCTAIQRLAGH